MYFQDEPLRTDDWTRHRQEGRFFGTFFFFGGSDPLARVTVPVPWAPARAEVALGAKQIELILIFGTPLNEANFAGTPTNINICCNK